MLLITHDFGVVAQLADRVAVMYAGRIVEIGPVEQMLRAPLHPYTQRLLGCIPRIGRRAQRLEQISGGMPRLDAIPDGCAFQPRCPSAHERCSRAAAPQWRARPLPWRAGSMADPLLQVRGLVRHFDASQAMLPRRLQARRRPDPGRRRCRSRRSCAARRSRWSANPAAASPRWRAAWSACCRRARDRSRFPAGVCR